MFIAKLKSPKGVIIVMGITEWMFSGQVHISSCNKNLIFLKFSQMSALCMIIYSCIYSNFTCHCSNNVNSFRKMEFKIRINWGKVIPSVGTSSVPSDFAQTYLNESKTDFLINWVNKLFYQESIGKHITINTSLFSWRYH